jgi:RNA polymerase sigma-70 factor (sigma-E family)
MDRTAIVHGVDRGGGVAAETRDADFAAYMHARQPALLRTAYLLTGDAHTAEDIVATALAKLYLAWDKVRDRESVDGYVRRIIANETTSLWRRPWRRREVAADVLPERGREDAYDDGRAAAVWRAVSSLPTRQRAVVVLRYYEELSEAEIADALGISPGTVKSQASRALATLRTNNPELASGLEER